MSSKRIGQNILPALVVAGTLCSTAMLPMASQKADPDPPAAHRQKSFDQSEFVNNLTVLVNATETTLETLRDKEDLRAEGNNTWFSKINLPGAGDCRLFFRPQTMHQEEKGWWVTEPNWYYRCDYPPTKSWAVATDFYGKLVDSATGVASWSRDSCTLTDTLKKCSIFHFHEPEPKLERRIGFLKTTNPRFFTIAVREEKNGTYVDTVTVWDRITTRTYVASTARVPNDDDGNSHKSSIGSEIESIQKGDYSPIPPGTIANDESLGPGQARLTITNKTSFNLRVLLMGPGEQALSILPGETVSKVLVSGSYKMAGRAEANNVVPYFSVTTLTEHSSNKYVFYVK